MKDNILLVALNAKYSHTSLAVRSISMYVKRYLGYGIPFCEFTVNDSYFYILENIINKNPEKIGFACYIWNIELVKKLVCDIKSINPGTEIFLGGPEVSYNENIFEEIPEIDFVINGEGEIPFLKYLNGENEIKGIRKKGEEIEFSDLADLSDIPFPYEEEELKALKNRAVYYETTRGCPFKCAFCLSSLTKGVRALPLERVFKEIDIFINAGIKRVKLVDRTFNYDKKRAVEIISYILAKSEDTCFHFEIGADLLDEKLIKLIKGSDKNVIQFEAGIQSTNEKTLTLCNRTTDMAKLNHNLKELSQSKMRVHVDLIAGLPEEDYESFKKSFDDAISLSPTVLQVGFLKLLHGSELRAEKEKYGYKFRCTPPYEVLSNNFISFSELMEIKKVDKAIEIYYNSRMFGNSLSAFPEETRPFEFFRKLGENSGDGNLSLKEKFKVLIDTFEEFGKKDMKELAKLDYFIKQRGVLPDFFDNFKSKKHLDYFSEIVNDPEKINKYLPHLSEAKQRDIIKRVDFEVFHLKEKEIMVLFDREKEIMVEIVM